MHPPSFQTSPGKDLSNGSSLSWVPHNTSNTGSSKLLRQHASATAVALVFDSMSLPAMSLTISSTLRQGCIGPRGCIQSCIDGLRKTKTHGQYRCRWGWVSSCRGRQPQAGTRKSTSDPLKTLGDHVTPVAAAAHAPAVSVAPVSVRLYLYRALQPLLTITPCTCSSYWAGVST